MQHGQFAVELDREKAGVRCMEAWHCYEWRHCCVAAIFRGCVHTQSTKLLSRWAGSGQVLGSVLPATAVSWQLLPAPAYECRMPVTWPACIQPICKVQHPVIWCHKILLLPAAGSSCQSVQTCRCGALFCILYFGTRKCPDQHSHEQLSGLPNWYYHK